MKHKIAQDWPSNARQAVALQNRLRDKVSLVDALPQVNHVAGVDVGFARQGAITRAAVVVLTYPGLQLMETQVAHTRTTMPYISGLLSFRELPAIVKAVEKLRRPPDLLLCDGQGIAHPRRFGIACHLGVLLDVAAIGVAKKRLYGSHAMPGNDKGEWTYLRAHDDDDAIIGAVLRSRAGARPLYISPGHRISLPTAIDYVLGCTTRYRLPETTRAADKLASNR